MEMGPEPDPWRPGRGERRRGGGRGDVDGNDDLGLTVGGQVASEEATRVRRVREGEDRVGPRLGSHGRRTCARITVDEG